MQFTRLNQHVVHKFDSVDKQINRRKIDQKKTFFASMNETHQEKQSAFNGITMQMVV
jgi:hypothetical protein